jgi:hypothetical protein
MEMILLDWTRMGKSYCLAGVVIEKDRYPIIRPLPVKGRDAPVRNVGWSPYLLDGHRRWEGFELVGLQLAAPQPPHWEDAWVRSLRPRHRSLPTEQRRAILQATAVPPGEPVFGEALLRTYSSAYLPPRHGARILATLLIPGSGIVFSASRRESSGEAEVRVALNIPPLGERFLPMKDHHLLLRAERGARNLTEQVRALQQEVRQMGETVAVRLGLSRPFAAAEGEEGKCWLMVDGIFSLAEPQT